MTQGHQKIPPKPTFHRRTASQEEDINQQGDQTKRRFPQQNDVVYNGGFTVF